MKNRILIWAATGLSIAAFWAAYLLPHSARRAPAAYTLARLTQPILLLSSYLGVGLRFYWVALLNALTYALIGLAVEMVWRKPLQAQSTR